VRIVLANELWYPDTFGGSERVARETAVRLSERGHDVIVWTLRNRTPGLPASERDGRLLVRRFGRVERHVVPRTVPMLGVGLRARRDARRADLVITHHTWPSVTVGLGIDGVPILHQFHAAPSLEWVQAGENASRRLGSGPLRAVRGPAFAGYQRLFAAAEGRSLRQAAAVTALSDFSRSILASRYPEVLDRLTLIPGGVDAERFRLAEDREAARAGLGFGPDETVVLSVRRMAPRMGLLELVRAVGRLRPDHPRLRLVLVGDGVLRPAIEAEVARLGLGDAVALTGRIDDDALVRHYQAADLFALPTQAYEGFGMVTLEALACGTPVVGTPVGATPEILRPLDPALVSRDASEEALADALRPWLGTDLGPVRARAREHALGYDWERIMDRYEALCREVAAGS
jgi:glycosyltransferase involved in cell wall biosynthesis